nr:MAG TPA: hypothetical protein [Caudoviricetes sp.]
MNAQQIFEANKALHAEAIDAFMKLQDEIGNRPDIVEQAKRVFLEEIEKFRTVENSIETARAAVGL